MIDKLLWFALGVTLAFMIQRPVLAAFKARFAQRRRHRRKIVVWTHEPMTDEQLRNALTSRPADDPFLLAVLQVIQEEVDEAQSEVGAFALARCHGSLAHTAGGVERLQILQGVFDDLMAGRARRQFKPSAHVGTVPEENEHE